MKRNIIDYSPLESQKFHAQSFLARLSKTKQIKQERDIRKQTDVLQRTSSPFCSPYTACLVLFAMTILTQSFIRVSNSVN
jgi:hypothetical protein